MGSSHSPEIPFNAQFHKHIHDSFPTASRGPPHTTLPAAPAARECGLTTLLGSWHVFSFAERARVRALVGVRVEGLLFLYCTVRLLRPAPPCPAPPSTPLTILAPLRSQSGIYRELRRCAASGYLLPKEGLCVPAPRPTHALARRRNAPAPPPGRRRERAAGPRGGRGAGDVGRARPAARW